ncbi:MAG TPA: hypothetical protein VE754_05580 [Actinomycetota bacterium]|jgi:hypothetical protein|nr:hypothetical protein [Actinomycetota bacterium]
MTRSPVRVVALCVSAGFLVAGAVTATAGTHVGLCTPGPDTLCHDLIRSLSLRIGVAAGVATVVVLLMIAGLARMAALDEQRRVWLAQHDISE